MGRVLLLMGGNVGDTSEMFRRAVELLGELAGSVERLSSEVETEPWGFDGDSGVAKFKNQALLLTTELDPEALLDVVQSVEREMGRERELEQQEREQSGRRYASRKIDIDIIFYDDILHKSDRLTIPHPLMAERDFVLRPMAEIVSEWRHPILGRSCGELLEELKREKICER